MRLITGLDERRELAVQIRMATAYERAMQASVEREMQRAYRDAATAIETGGQLFLPMSQHRERMARIYRAVYEEVMPAFGGRLLNSAGKAWARHLRQKDARGEFEAAIQRFLLAVGARAVVAATTTQDQIRAAVVAGEAEGMSQIEIGRQILQGAPDLQGIGFWTPRVRSRIIARTEVHTAASVASDEAARASGVVEQKEWIAAEDDRTRPDHAEADGQVVGLNDAFSVGGASMKYPGEPGAPAAQVVNCRCVSGYLTGI